MQEKAIITVSELNEYARRLLASDPLLRFLEVRGEISGYKHHYSGHRYFSLKDESARVQCVMFRQNGMSLDFEPEEGMQVIVEASASIFTRDGSYQLYVSRMRRAGRGDLYVRFEKLKQKLLAEGLFDPARKRPIPQMPRVIGVVTSKDGAALRDIIHVARRRNPNVGIVISPCSVQGDGAAEDIVRGIRRLNRANACDVMLVGRGGGSIEDLWAFNEEIVARAIAESQIPVVSCVGHEVDYTIADFVADLRAPTPSAAAEMAVPELEQMNRLLETVLSRLSAALMASQRAKRLELERMCASSALVRPALTLIEPRRALIRTDGDKLVSAISMQLERKRHRLNALESSLRALDPEAVISRGYAVVYRGDTLVSDVGDINIGAHVAVRLAGGAFHASVTSIIAGEEPNER